MSIDNSMAPCRSLFSNGEWQVPPDELPIDWQELTAVRYDAPTKAPYVTVRGEGGAGKAKKVKKTKKPKVPKGPKGFQPGHPRYGGKKTCAATRRITITGPEILVRLEKGDTIYTLAKKLKCHASLLYRLVSAAGLQLPAKKCQKCGEPTGKRHQAKFCATCATATWRGWTDEARDRLAQGAAKCRTCGVAPGLHALGDCSKCYQRNRKAAA